MTLTDIIETGCAAIAIDADGMEQPCGGPVVAVRRWTGCGDGDGIGGVCAKHAAEPGAELMPLKDIPDRPALPFPLTYEDVEDGAPPTSRGWAITDGPSGKTPTARMRRPFISNGTETPACRWHCWTPGCTRSRRTTWTTGSM